MEQQENNMNNMRSGIRNVRGVKHVTRISLNQIWLLNLHYQDLPKFWLNTNVVSKNSLADLWP